MCGEAEKNLLPNPGFESGLRSWQRRGKAQFAQDRKVACSGRASARITIPEGAKPWYQCLFYELRNVEAGEEYHAEVMVRTRGVAKSPGAYMALEYLRGGRVGIDHSRTGATLGKAGWVKLTIDGVVPEGAERAHLLLILHDNGTAWFDDAKLIRKKEVPVTPLTLTLRPQKTISRNWRGFGAQGDLFFWRERVTKHGVNDKDRALIRKRILEMRPQVVRLLFDLRMWEPERGKRTPNSEGMRDLCNTLAIYKEAGTDIMLTEWGYGLPKWCRATKRAPHPEERAAFAESWVSAVKFLRDVKGFTNLGYACIYNEPNWGGVSFEDYAAVYRALDAALKKAGLRDHVSILGPDEANQFRWLPWAVKELDDVIDVYDVHNYASNTGPQFERWVRQRLDIIPKIPKPRPNSDLRKPLMVCEFGMRTGQTTYTSSENHKYVYGLFLADASIVSARAGVNGMLMWCLSDTYYGRKMLWGLWRFRDEGWEPRPGYYAWSLLTRYTERGSTVHPVEVEGTHAAAVAFRAPDKGRWTLLLVNRAKKERSAAWRGLPPRSKWVPYVYSQGTVPTPDRGMIEAGEGAEADAAGELAVRVAPQSFILLRE